MVLLKGLQGSNPGINTPCGLARKAGRLEHRGQNAVCHGKGYSSIGTAAGVVGMRGKVVWHEGKRE